MKIKEEYINIKTRDKENISGNFISNNNKKIIIFIHGFTGNSSEAQFFEAKKYFSKKGFDLFFMDLYSWEEKDKRFLWNTSIKQHTSDLEDTIKYFSKKYDSIFLIGHSIGGPIIYLSKNINKNKKIKSVVFWEPTIEPRGVEEDFVYDKRVDRYFSYGYFVSKEFVDELKSLKSDKIKNFKKPFKIILNKNGMLVKNWNKAKKFIKADFEWSEIKNSGHDFTKGNAMIKLMKESFDFIKKY